MIVIINNRMYLKINGDLIPLIIKVKEKTGEEL